MIAENPDGGSGRPPCARHRVGGVHIIHGGVDAMDLPRGGGAPVLRGLTGFWTRPASGARWRVGAGRRLAVVDSRKPAPGAPERGRRSAARNGPRAGPARPRPPPSRRSTGRGGTAAISCDHRRVGGGCGGGWGSDGASARVTLRFAAAGPAVAGEDHPGGAFRGRGFGAPAASSARMEPRAWPAEVVHACRRRALS